MRAAGKRDCSGEEFSQTKKKRSSCSERREKNKGKTQCAANEQGIRARSLEQSLLGRTGEEKGAKWGGFVHMTSIGERISPVSRNVRPSANAPRKGGATGVEYRKQEEGRFGTKRKRSRQRQNSTTVFPGERKSQLILNCPCCLKGGKERPSLTLNRKKERNGDARPHNAFMGKEEGGGFLSEAKAFKNGTSPPETTAGGEVNRHTRKTKIQGELGGGILKGRQFVIFANQK